MILAPAFGIDLGATLSSIGSGFGPSAEVYEDPIRRTAGIPP
jgi:hypothetical protein